MSTSRGTDGTWVNDMKSILRKLNTKYLNRGDESIKDILKLLKICSCSGIKFNVFFEGLKESVNDIFKFRCIEVVGKYKQFVMNSCKGKLNIGIVKSEKNKFKKLQKNLLSLSNRSLCFQKFGANVIETLHKRELILRMAKKILRGYNDMEVEEFKKTLELDIKSTRARVVILVKK